MMIETIQYGVGGSSVGMLLAARRVDKICAILFGDSAQDLTVDLQTRFSKAILARDDDALAPTLTRISAQIETPSQCAGFEIDPAGTKFQQRVWRALRDIPCGATASYADIARMIGAPKAARAVAGACAANPVAVVIPCHRVVRGDGGLSGYRWGIARKRALLTREGAI